MDYFAAVVFMDDFVVVLKIQELDLVPSIAQSLQVQVSQ
jgi:hypothetical protein